LPASTKWYIPSPNRRRASDIPAHQWQAPQPACSPPRRRANPVSFVWDGDDLLDEYRSSGVSCRNGVLDGDVLDERRDGSRYLYVHDLLGSVANLLDTSQTIAGTYTSLRCSARSIVVAVRCATRRLGPYFQPVMRAKRSQ